MLGHVGDDPLPHMGPSRVVADEGCLVAHPDHEPVARHEPVFHLERIAAPARFVPGSDHAVEVVGVDERPPRGRVREPFLGGAAQEVDDLRADVVLGRVEREVRVADRVRHGREAFDQRPVLRLGRLARLLDGAALGDVDHDALPEARRASVAADEVRLVVDPDEGAVVSREPVLHHERLARLRRSVVLRQHAGAIPGWIRRGQRERSFIQSDAG